ncbi:MAG: hypothetical protein COA71_14505 [SAR86 cluster bacterium]|uniref:Uncharacterized protein n=1 Tax=SAR86 cluster bacterium TaxID=2030880 RepID=A0A2A5C757_9GAMM|nr:MAG: hypothetical protein COA71_14505 [SAR86 cluster bacterium]
MNRYLLTEKQLFDFYMSEFGACLTGTAYYKSKERHVHNLIEKMDTIEDYIESETNNSIVINKVKKIEVRLLV